jgi:hypothetical protein
MKRILVGLSVLLVSACDLLPTGGSPLVEVEHPFTLREGQRAVVRGPRLVVEFVDVPVDERCPIEAMCVSPGDAVVRVRLSQGDRPAQMFDLHTLVGEPRGVYGDYAVELMEVQPPASLQVPDPNYRVRLRVDPVFHID